MSTYTEGMRRLARLGTTGERSTNSNANRALFQHTAPGWLSRSIPPYWGTAWAIASPPLLKLQPKRGSTGGLNEKQKQAMHVKRHGRFYLAALAGVSAGAVGFQLPLELRLVLGGDVFFLVYLALMTVFAARVTPDGLRARAAEEDEGLPLILLLTLAAIVLNLSAIFVVLNSQAGGFGLSTLVALVSVPLGWAAVHTLAAFHYANLFYAPHPDGGETRGLRFPGEAEPGAWDFLYFAFVIGMTAQVSDVAVASTLLRRVVLAHAVLSFFYYAVILAVAVNAAVNAASSVGPGHG